MQEIRSRLFVMQEGIFFLTEPGLVSEFHSHYAISIILSLDNSFTIETLDKTTSDCRFVILGSNAKHKLIALNSKIVVIQLDPHQEEAVPLSNWVKKATIHHLSRERISQFIPDLESVLNQGTDCNQIEIIFHKILQLLGSEKRRNKIIDPRIKKSMDFIKSNLLEPMTVRKLSDAIGLSETRFMHIFKQEIGIPVRRYVLWQRINAAIKSLQSGGNLTEAAYAAGFSDQSHMSRTVKDMLGVQPSLIFQPANHIDIQFCEVRES
ncbi:helix-turn-helix transcriptional regulator [Leptospira sp. GIMC2001]|uniref:helix-turn-helix transcriptional regulator n=1 Tax=Leptospira sp. GIMC2001 TaxID=1513297 RepID=UPI00234A82DF|nr:AraC family transcriptional regulator [Leptospira sp. GIMC2001]WCL50149.1 AraC family transcriptional regulator [Leptospira sp. GIMC2001]